MVVMPQVVTSTGEGVIATYTFTDLVTQAGYVRYYGGSVQASSYILSTQQFYSNEITTTASVNNTSKAGTPDIDIDFDLTEFTKPQTIRGIGVLSLPVSVNVTGGASETHHFQLDFVIRKWDGATETDIATGTGTDVSFTTASTGLRTGKVSAPVTIPSTKFGIGETLRVTAHLYVWSSQSYSKTYAIGHDPQNRTGLTFPGSSGFNTNDDVIMDVLIPFKVAL